MIVFAVTTISVIPTLDAIVEANFPGNSLKVRDGLWLIAANSTPQAVSNALGITPGDIGSAMVVQTAGYFGRAPTHVWDWMTSKLAS